MASPADGTYSSAFFAQNVKSSTPSAVAVLSRLAPLYTPASVVDFGCGSGAWLAGAGVTWGARLRGFDGPWVDPRELTDSGIEFTALDFEKELPNPGERFDLGISVEVAEHLQEQTAKDFIARLCSVADVIVFGGAVPYQGGTHHINEHPQSYWINEFTQNGFEMFDIFRGAVWGNSDVKWWFKQNTFLFVKRGFDGIDRDRLRELETPLVDVIHPENFVRKITLNKARIRELEATVKQLEARLSSPDPGRSADAVLLRLSTIESELTTIRTRVETPAPSLLRSAPVRKGRTAARKLLRTARSALKG